MGRSPERIAARIEDLIQRHRPTPEQENAPASPTQLDHLNSNGLIPRAMYVQKAFDTAEEVEKSKVVITRLAAWQVLAEAQRGGLRIEPRRARV